MLGSLDRETLRTVESMARHPVFIPPSTLFHVFDEQYITSVNQILAADMDFRAFALADEPEVIASEIRSRGGILSYTVSRNVTVAYLTMIHALPPLELNRSGQPVANPHDEPQGVWSWDIGRERPWLFLASEDRGLFLYDWEAGGTPEPLDRQGVFPIAGPGDTLVAFLNWRQGRPRDLIDQACA